MKKRYNFVELNNKDFLLGVLFSIFIILVHFYAIKDVFNYIIFNSEYAFVSYYLFALYLLSPFIIQTLAYYSFSKYKNFQKGLIYGVFLLVLFLMFSVYNIIIA